MQLDLFGATENTAIHQSAPPVMSDGAWRPPEALAFDSALRRGALGDAINVLNSLKVNAAARVLLSSGFAMGSMSNRASMMADVQSDLVAAARQGITGAELLASKKIIRSASLMDVNLKIKEKDRDHGTIANTENVLDGNGAADRGNGRDGGVNRESLGDGLAGSGGDVASLGEVSGRAGGADGSGEGRSVERGELAAPGAARDIADERNQGSAADDLGAEFGATVNRSAVVTDYVLTDEDRIGLGGLAEKFQDNLQAIRVLRTLDAENRHAVDEEKRDLARYVGWGGIKGVFDPDNKQWGRQHLALKALLSDDEWAAASRSQLDAFYTPPVIANAMYSAVSRFGFAGGRTLDPSVGVGNFFGFMPPEIRQNSALHGVELDILSSQIVSALYPNAKIAKATGFQAYNVPAGYFDLVIGNPPFGSQAIADDKGSVYSGWSIHNYFFAKSIEMLRPGGIMPMVVSHNFLDKLDPHVRNWIARRAELVSGVRLPKTAFKENANTEVVTDVLIFKRLDQENMIGKQELPDWLNTSEIQIENPKTGEMELVAVNDYFINNPQNVLGTNSTESSQFRANEYTVLPNGDLDVQLAGWVESLPIGIYVPLERSAKEMELAAAAVEVPENIKEGSFYLQGDAIWRRLPDAFGERRAVEWTPPNQRAMERMVGMIRIRDALRGQMRLERSVGSTEAMVEDGRRELNALYDNFSGKFGYLNDPINRRLFIDDTESALLQALEFDYEKAITPVKAEEFGIEPRPARAVKADIFTRRVLFPPVDIEIVETAKDALLHSLNSHGCVDMGYMQAAYGKDEDAIVVELGDLLFVDPVRGRVTADEYLSGDVKTKLAEATKAAGTNSEFARNLAALEKVIPVDKMPSEIHVAIGAAWVPVEVFAAFAKEVSGANVTFGYIAATAQWVDHIDTATDYVKNSNEYGTERMGATTILSHMMNSRGLEVKERRMIEGVERYVTDETATEEVRQRGDKIRAHWDTWVWSDGDRADKLTSIYNERFNRTVERHFDGSHLTFPGMNLGIELLAHQKNGVWRGLQDRNMLLDQVVGAGKTYEVAAMVMEMRRLGISKKPLIAVPNHLTLQWRSEFARLYPGANVLAATPQDFDKENRERLFSKIVTGNWDAVIVGHSSLKKIAVPLAAETRIIKEQFNDIVDAIEEMKKDRGDRNIIRDMEKIKGTLEAKIIRLNEKGGKKDNMVDFGDLGVDALFVDEMHEFKNLFFTTQMNRVAGLGNPAGSGKAFDLFVKVRWLQDTFGENAPLVTATGTPVSNSLAEMFTMQRYMKYGAMKADGLHMFDAWAKQYGDVQNVYEVAPSGTGYRLSQRFAKFKNLPSLMGSYRSFADVITLDDLKAQEIARGKVFPVPKLVGGRPLNVVANRSELQEKFFGVPEIVKSEAGEIVFEIDLSHTTSIEQREDGQWTMVQEIGAQRITSAAYATQEEAAYMMALGATTPKMTVDPESIVGQFENLRELTRKTKGKINALSLTGLANKAGLDYRIIDPAAQDFEGSKINQAIGNMHQIYEQWHADKGVQLVFCDLSVPLSAKAKMADKEKRIYVRDDKGDVSHKKGTLHTIKEYEGLPYYLVAEGKGKDKTFTMYDPVSGRMLKNGFDGKQEAHGFASAFVAKEGGQERWLTIREQFPPIEAEEIDDYKNEHSLDADGDAADLEISLQDVEGATGVAAFSVYDDIKAKLIARGIPATQVEFIHDHDTPQAKDMLFKRVNAGDVRFLLGSTPKMGAGTNVQKRLVGMHHIDAPWRPSDLEQREGRIIRRGNMLYERDPEGFQVNVNRYATAQTYDTRRWQLLEHKAAGVEQLRNYDGGNEIDDVATEASNSADMKAAASGNPLILKETQLSNEVKKLHLLERAHRDGDYVVRSRMNHHRNYSETYGPNAVMELRTLVAQRDSARVLSLFEGKPLAERDDVLAAIEKIDTAIDGFGVKKSIVYRGLSFTFERDTFSKFVVMKMPDGHSGSMAQLSPSGVITRMENCCNGLEKKIDDMEVHIQDSAAKAAEMSGLLGKPFAQTDLLMATIADHGKVQRALMKSNSMAAVRPEERAAFDAAVGGQKALLRGMGFDVAVKEIEGEDVVEVHVIGQSQDQEQALMRVHEQDQDQDQDQDRKDLPSQLTAAEVDVIKDIPTTEKIDEAITAVGEDSFKQQVFAKIAKYKPTNTDQEAMLVEATAIEIIAKSRRENAPFTVTAESTEAQAFAQKPIVNVEVSESAPVTERERIARRYAEVLAEGRAGVSGEPHDHHYTFADAVIEKNAYRLDYLANGLNDTGKRVFTEVTGIALPKQQGATWAVIRKWGGISVEEDLKNQAWHKVVVERRAIEPKIGIDPFIWANGKIENGFNQVKKIERETWLMNEAGQGFNLSKKGSHLHLLVPYIKAMTEYEVARGAAQGLEGVKDAGLSVKATAPAAPELVGGKDALSSIATAAELGVDTRASVGLDAIMGVDVDHLKTRMVDSMPVEAPAGWVVMNAPRPLLGSQTMTGDFVTGRFYAAISPDDLMAEKFIEENRKLDARMLVEVPRDVQMEMVMGEYRDRYLEMDVDRRWEILSSKLHELRDLPYGELKAKVAEVSVAPEVSSVADKAMAVEVKVERQTFEHDGYQIYPRAFQDGREVWCLQTQENKVAGKLGFGDTIHHSVDDAMKEAARQSQREAKRVENDAIGMAAAAEIENKKEVNRGLSISERRANSVLDGKTVSFPYSSGLGSGTWREVMGRAVEQGRAIIMIEIRDDAAEKRDQKAMDDGRRAGWMLGYSNENLPGVKRMQEASDRLKADDYKKPQYRLYSSADQEGSFFEINKTAHDYALSLMEKNIVVEAKIESDSAPVVKAGNIVVSGSHSGLVTSVANGIVTQKINRDGEVALHAAVKLSKPVKEGDVVDIHYRMGFGEVKARERGSVEIAR